MSILNSLLIICKQTCDVHSVSRHYRTPTRVLSPVASARTIKRRLNACIYNSHIYLFAIIVFIISHLFVCNYCIYHLTFICLQLLYLSLTFICLQLLYLSFNTPQNTDESAIASGVGTSEHMSTILSPPPLPSPSPPSPSTLPPTPRLPSLTPPPLPPRMPPSATTTV
jgi:hypothetical protein